MPVAGIVTKLVGKILTLTMALRTTIEWFPGSRESVGQEIDHKTVSCSARFQ